MKYYSTPNDEDCIGCSDSVSIQNAIKKAKKCGFNKVIIPSYNARSGGCSWIIDKTVFLPGNIHIILDNCYLRMADDAMCNMFCNSNCYTEIGNTLEGEQENIIIEGIGNCVLDGGKYNGLSERTSLKDGNPHIINNTTIFFHNVNHFVVNNLRIINQRWWGMTFMFARNGKIHDIDFNGDLSTADEEGKRVDKMPTTYEEVYLKNGDGIDLRVGCNNIIIESITGFTEDDSVALTALCSKYLEQKMAVAGRDTDIHSVIIKNIMTKTVCSNIRLLNGGGNKLYNIVIDSVVDASLNDYPYKSPATIRIGDFEYPRYRYPVMGEIYNISINNIVSRGVYAISLDNPVKNVSIKNIHIFEEDTVAIGSMNGGEWKNITVDGIFFENNPGPDKVFIHERKSSCVCMLNNNVECDNVLIKNVFADNCENIIDGENISGIEFENVRVK